MNFVFIEFNNGGFLHVGSIEVLGFTLVQLQWMNQDLEEELSGTCVHITQA